MSVKPIIESLRELISIHDALIKTAEDKTEVIKAGNIEMLQQMLVRERKYIQLLESKEEKRKRTVESWFTSRNFQAGDKTVTNMFAAMENETEKRELEEKTAVLTERITVLKQLEQLNQALVQQSLQFVQLSLDMLNPTISNMNYGNGKGNATGVKRSVFDSKA